MQLHFYDSNLPAFFEGGKIDAPLSTPPSLLMSLSKSKAAYYRRQIAISNFAVLLPLVVTIWRFGLCSIPTGLLIVAAFASFVFHLNETNHPSLQTPSLQTQPPAYLLDIDRAAAVLLILHMSVHWWAIGHPVWALLCGISLLGITVVSEFQEQLEDYAFLHCIWHVLAFVFAAVVYSLT